MADYKSDSLIIVLNTEILICTSENVWYSYEDILKKSSENVEVYYSVISNQWNIVQFEDNSLQIQ